MFSELYKFVLNLRYLMCAHIYGNHNNIIELMESIRKSIDPVSIEFDSGTYAFYIKIKKTNMKRYKGFSNIPEFYYSHFIIPVFFEFISNHYNELLALSDKALLDNTLINQTPLINICHVTCISDNMVIVKL